MRFFLSALVSAAFLLAADDAPVFKTDVALTRVDAQVVDREGRTVTNLRADDFVLRMNGQLLPIRNFASENMPIDILLLLDVSGSMRPHVQRIAAAAQDALNVLAAQDRVAIMVFDTRTRVRLPFENSHSEVTSELNHLLRSEGFNGGTRITQALVDAANYVGREGRPGARRAIVILTDDQTQDGEDEPRVEAALTRANAVLSFLQAPYEPQPGGYGRGGGGGPRRGGTWGSGGGWPGGGGIGFPGGGGPVILGRRGPGGYGGMDPSHSAGTATIAADSGGDTMPVHDASALEDTLARLRRRYALYFYLPEGTQSGRSSVQVDLSQEAKLRYSGAEVRSRRVYLAGGGPSSGIAEPAVVTRVQQPADTTTTSPTLSDEQTPKGRRKAVNEDSGPKVNTVGDDAGSSEQTSTPAKPTQGSGWPRAHQFVPEPAQN